jgi:hypothetical protein
MTEDPELQELFTDPAHQEILDLLKASRPGTPPLDPNFRSYLRAKLMTEARKTLPRRSQRSWLSFSLTPRTLAPAMAAIAAGFLIVLGVEIYLHNPTTPPGATLAVHVEQLNNKKDVAVVEPIEIPFSGPVDKNAVAESVVIEPATSATKQWVGSTLVIIPDHPLAPNTTYTVRLQPKAAPTATPSGASSTPAATAAPTPVVVHFTTARGAIPPVVPPSFKSSSITYGYDSRLANAGTILNATWTSGGQLLVTRPAFGSGSAASASTTASAAPTSKATTNVWLMSPLGTPVTVVAANATLPSAPASGDIFAAWTLSGGNQATLDVHDLKGNLIATVASLNGTPDRPAVWVGTDRLAYVANGHLQLVDLHGNKLPLPAVNVAQGSVAASPNGTLIAVEGVDGSVVIDLTGGASAPLHAGASGFAWSSKGDLAFIVQHDSRTDLYVASDGKNGRPVATSPSGQTWSDVNWAPDAASLLLANRPTGSNGTASALLVINRDGSNPTAFGAPQREYASPQWSASGSLVLFTRHDDVSGAVAFWTATAATSGANAAEQLAVAEVDTFMQARIRGDSAAAQGELDANGQAAYQNGTSSLVSAGANHFDRYYPVTVQLTGTNPNEFLIGVRIFMAGSNGTETSFFEEQLTVVQQDQRYVIHGVTASPAVQLGRGPNVLSFDVLEAPPGQQVRVRFDADLNPQTVSSSTIQIKDSAGNVVVSKVTFDANNHLATLTVRLRQGTYQLVVTTGVTDINGAPLAREYDATVVISR